MGWLFVILFIAGDLWLYSHGGRPENSIWKDETIKWM